MPVLLLVVAVILAKIVLIDSPLGQALGDAIRQLAPPKSEGGASRAELEGLRRDVDELRDLVDRVVEEQSFLTRLLSKPPGHIGIGPGKLDDEETGT